MNRDHNRRIIIVAEDDPDDRILIHDALSEADLHNRADFVADGVSLMDYLHEREGIPDYQQKTLPELILLDLNMPKKDGWQVLEELKQDEQLKGIPVVILTTSSSQEDIQRSYMLGGNGFITKPSTYSGLVDIMRSLNEYWFKTVRLP